MADRTVKVRLELDDDAFKGGLKGDAAAVRDFDGEVRTLGDHAARTGVEMKAAGNDIQATGEEIKAVGRAAVPTTDQVRKLGDESADMGKKATQARDSFGRFVAAGTEAAASINATGEESRKTSARLQHLSHDIKDTEETVRLLSHAWVQTRDADIGPMLRGQQEALRGLRAEYQRVTAEADKGPGLFSRLFGLATPSIANSEIKAMKDTGLQAGEAFSGGFLSTVAAGLGAASPVLAPALFALISGAAAAAGLGTAGAGAIATGLVLQLSDPRVKAAAADLGFYVKTQFEDLTSGFAGQFVSGFEALKREAAPLFTDLRSGFQSLDPYVSNLLVRLGEGLAKLGPGLSRALQASGPILAVLANNIPTLLNGVNIFFDEISKGGKGAAEALDAIIKGISALIAGLGFALRIGADMYDVLVQGADKFWSIMSKAVDVLAPFSAAAAAAAGPIHALADYTHGVATSFDQARLSADTTSGAFGSLGSAAAASAVGIGSSRQALLDWQGAALTADQAAGAWRQGMLGLHDAVKQNGVSLKENTTAGEANIQMLQDMVGKARANRDAQIAQGISVAYADQQYQAQIGTLIDNATHLGFNRTQVENLIGRYKQVPGSVSTQVQAPGLDAAIRGGQSLDAILNGLNGKVATSTVITYYKTIHQEVTQPGVGQGTTEGTRGAAAIAVPRRYGGVTEHAADGLLREAQTFTAASTGARYAFAEPQTQGEAFIPRSGDLARSRSIWSYVGANWLGMKGAGGHGSVTTINVTVNAGIGTDVYAVGRQLADAIKPYIRSAGGGNVQAALGVRGS
jgi:hypothetical protein